MYKRKWTKELEKKAQKELNETPNKKEERLQHIKEWIAKESHLNARPDTEWLLNFLRGSKYNTERVKEKLEYLYKTKAKLPEFFSNRDPFLPELQEIMNRWYGVVEPQAMYLVDFYSILVPYSTEHEEMIIVRWSCSDANKVSISNLFKIAFMILDIVLMESSTLLVMGYHIIVDLRGFPLRYMSQLTPWMIKNISLTLIKGYPIRIKGIYVFGTFPFFPTLYKMFTAFLNSKILDRIKVYQKYDSEELCKYINISSIPEEYGGHSKSIYEVGRQWKTFLESYQKWFLEDENYKAVQKE